jgi:chitinase
VKQQLNIVSGESLAGGNIRIYDVNGKLVIDARAATNRIDVSSLSSGVYTLIFTKNQTKITKKFVK